MTRERPQAEGAPIDLDDENCMSRIASGDQSALADLYDRHSGVVYSLACRMLGGAGDAEDVVQDVFIQAWRQASRFDASRGSGRGWLLMMTRARSIDRLRARGIRPAPAGTVTRTAGALPDAGPNPETTALRGEEAVRVAEALAALEPAQRLALELAYYEGLTQTEIAAALKEPLGTIKSRVRTALSRLRSALVVGGQP